MRIRCSWLTALGTLTLAVLVMGCGDDTPRNAFDALPVDNGDAAADGSGDRGPVGDALSEAGDAAGDAARDGADDAAGNPVDAGDAAAGHAGDAPDASTTDGGGMEVGASCSDNARNGDETDVDCGGVCGHCGVGKSCRANTDCGSGACNASHICVECFSAANCPGQDQECSVRACVGGACVVALVAAQTVLPTQTAGDCRSRRCDGFGQVVQVADDTDLPNDNNPCTRDVCESGAPSNPPAPAATTCGTGKLCDGLGHCVGCLTAADCPGTDNECSTRTCDHNLCGVIYRAAGAPTASQTTGDCKVSECDGNGNARQVPLDTDLPDDGKVCTRDQCAGGVASSAPLASGATCGGANICDGTGHCVQCVTASTCPGQDGDCQMRTCIAGICGLARVEAGTALAVQTAGDCKASQCDGLGHVVAVNDDNDKPTDGNACTDDVCTAGMASNPRRTVGAACGAGTRCDAAAHCVACITAADCPGQDTACRIRVCTAQGTCDVDLLANGTPVVAQTPGDCQVLACDGHGTVVSLDDDADRPVDGNACTDDVCALGVPSNPPLAEHVSCGGHNECDGAGHCIGCLVAADCLGQDTACQVRTCGLDFVCGLDNVMDGTPAGSQTAGDCRVSTCDGGGNLRVVVDDTDIPADNNPCTRDVCLAGIASNPALPAGVACSGGNVCDGQGHCVACVADGDCGVDGVCRTHACGADHTCATHDVPGGTPLALQVVGDCHVAQCDGLGSSGNIVDDGDVPVDGNPCTQDLCVLGVASNPLSPSGTSCPGGVCDGAGHCVTCVVAADCGADTACQTHACGADHTCSTTNVPSGTALPDATQVAGDCRVVQCDGQGGQIVVASPSDVLDDGNSCTDDLCQGLTPAHPLKAAGTSCGGTSICDGVGNCGPAPVDAGTDSGTGTGGCPAPYLFCDDFEDGDAAGWTVLEQTTSTPGVWTIVSENGHAGATTFDLQGTGASTSYHYDVPSVTGAGGPWEDQTVSVWIKPTVTLLNSDNNKVGLCARLSTNGNNDTTSAYCLFLRADTGAVRGRLQISKKVAGGALAGLLSTTTSSFPPATIPLFALDTWYKVTFQVSGSTSVVLTASINDVPLATFTDSAAPITSGGPALILRGATASFDDLRLSSP